MREQFVRGCFSFLAAAVTLTMAAEHLEWFVERGETWRLLPAGVLAALALTEAQKVFKRADLIISKHG